MITYDITPAIHQVDEDLYSNGESLERVVLVCVAASYDMTDFDHGKYVITDLMRKFGTKGTDSS